MFWPYVTEFVVYSQNPRHFQFLKGIASDSQFSCNIWGSELWSSPLAFKQLFLS